MSLALMLIGKIVPIYLLVGTGYIAGRYGHVQREAIANLLIFILSPAVIFLGTIQVQTTRSLLLIPLLVLAIGTCWCLISNAWAKRCWTDGTNRLLAFTSGTGNAGYFGLPVCLILFGEMALPVVVMVILGMLLFENILGYYMLARTSHTWRAAVRHVLVLPTIYAFLLGVVCNLSGVTLPAIVIDTLIMMKGAYAPIGMLMVGLGLRGIRFEHVDRRFLLAGVGIKFCGWFGLMWGFLALDRTMFHLLPPYTYPILLIEALAPVAANSVPLAIRFRAHPEKAALLVVISTVAALGVIPVAAAILLRR